MSHADSAENKKQSRKLRFWNEIGSWAPLLGITMGAQIDGTILPIYGIPLIGHFSGLGLITAIWWATHKVISRRVFHLVKGNGWFDSWEYPS